MAAEFLHQGVPLDAGTNHHRYFVQAYVDVLYKTYCGMQYGSREVLCKQKVGSLSNVLYGLRKFVPGQGLQFLNAFVFYIAGTADLHPEGVACA